MKTVIILVTSILISSCYVYSPKTVDIYYNYEINTSVIEQDKIVETSKPENVQVVNRGCPKFNLPVQTELPSNLDSEAIKNSTSQEELDLLLVNQIKKLIGYITEERKRIETEYQNYLDEC